jgi:hypothetical protein
VGENNKNKQSIYVPRTLVIYSYRESGTQVSKVAIQCSELIIQVETGYLDERVNIWSNCCLYSSFR